MWPGPRPTFVPRGILIHPPVWSQQTWAENLGLCPLGMGELGPHLKQCRLARGLPPYQVASSSIQPFGHNRYGPKIWGCALIFGDGFPSTTMWPGPRPTSLPSGILIHPAVWTQLPLKIRHNPQFSAHVYCGQTVAHLSYC